MNIKRLFNRGMKLLTDADYRFLVLSNRGKYDSMPDEEYLKRKFKAFIGQELNLENPQTFNEKLQWLKLYNRRPEYTMMVDKYKVRDYIAEKLGEEYLIPLLDAWDDPDDIDFDALPNQFVLKCNHNSGLGMCICKDKSKLDIPKVKEELRKGLAQNYYLTSREWPYKDVPRKIICEKYMVDESGTELKDYKTYCFNGKAKMLMVVSDRFSGETVKASYFDRDRKQIPVEWGMEMAELTPPKPEVFEKMCSMAEILAKDIPHVRIDFYLIGNKIYFGEITFFDGSGFDEIKPVEWDYEFGKWITLPQKKD